MDEIERLSQELVKLEYEVKILNILKTLVPSFSQMVRLFYNKVLADPLLSPYFSNVNIEGLRSRQEMFLTMLVSSSSFNAPSFDIRNIHYSSHITSKAFDVLMQYFRATLDDMGVNPEVATFFVDRLLKFKPEVCRGGIEEVFFYEKRR
jgi:hemoglobin